MIPYYVVNSFTDKQFSGNPAGVCILNGDWPTSETMQSIAAENKLSETAFVKRKEDGSYDLRFFSPGSEVGLCGHATLGTTFVLAKYIDSEADLFRYHTRDEDVSAKKLPEDRFALQFPAWRPQSVPMTETIRAALGGLEPVELLGTRDLIAVLDSEEAVRRFVPNQEAIGALPEEYLGLLITAIGRENDFVDRSFFPKLTIPEDPVCGSAKCSLIPLWAERLGKTELSGKQLSKRSGMVYCRMLGDHVEISGNVTLYLRGEINL